MSEWRDISTAPRDGTWMLGWEGPSGTSCGILVMRWKPEGSWFEEGWYDDGKRQAEPTHWMPLPAPPANQGEGGE